MNRRRFLIGATSLLAAPAIVRVASLMPVRALPVDPLGTPGHVRWKIQIAALTLNERWMEAYETAAFRTVPLIEGEAACVDAVLCHTPNRLTRNTDLTRHPKV